MGDVIKHYRDLKVWQKAMLLAQATLKATEAFPQSQRFILTQQMQRCAISIPSNIAEGRARHSEKEFLYHLNVAKGSLAELETQILLSLHMKFLNEDKANELLALCEEVTKMIHGLKGSFSNSRSPLTLAKT